MRIIEKSWGVTRCVFRNSVCEVWHASIREGETSSYHHHVYKHNGFYVVSGRLRILRSSSSINVLQAGDSYTCSPGEPHMFLADEDTELIETYWLDSIDPEDIVRNIELTEVYGSSKEVLSGR